MPWSRIFNRCTCYDTNNNGCEWRKGKGRNPPEFKDPPLEDEADVYMHGLLKNLKGDFFAQKAG